MSLSPAEFWLAVGLMSAATYATRLPGLLLARPLPGALGRALAAIPAAVFAALAAPPLVVATGSAGPSLALQPATLVPAVVACLVARRTRQAAAGLAAGLAAAVAFRLVP
jgi:branched-subunit amino acid transport protein